MLAILGFGSLISEPGTEIKAATERTEDIETPFPVEFARESVCRGGAPTLVRVKDGKKVKAVLFILKNEITEQEASSILWRRETDQVGSTKEYKRPKKPGVNSVLVETLKNLAGIETILYTDFLDSGKLQSPRAKQLAEMAINSAKAPGVKEGKDGITYLRKAIDAGVNTRLTQDYQAEILKAMGTKSLQEAQTKLTSKSSQPGGSAGKAAGKENAMANGDKNWETFEDAFRSILDAHKEFFGLERVEPGPAQAVSESGYVYSIEVMGFRKGDEKQVLFECRRKATRNLEPGHAGEFAYRILTTGAAKGYFVTTLDRGLSAGAKTLADHAQIGHIQLSADSTSTEYLMKWLNNTAIGVSITLGFSMEAAWQHLDKDGNVIAEGKAKG